MVATGDDPVFFWGKISKGLPFWKEEFPRPTFRQFCNTEKILQDSLKSLKTAKTSSSSPLAAANLSDYASKVRDAYEEMKKTLGFEGVVVLFLRCSLNFTTDSFHKDLPYR